MRRGYMGSGADERNESAADAALAVLAGYFPEADRERFRRRFAETMANEFRLSGMDPPEWLERL
ncbi:MAG TPA: hypothetical protein VFR37_11825 [Longimicrobium sp.]|nr:hypothetical protein [Longimicrobium sp.]